MPTDVTNGCRGHKEITRGCRGPKEITRRARRAARRHDDRRSREAIWGEPTTRIGRSPVTATLRGLVLRRLSICAL